MSSTVFITLLVAALAGAGGALLTLRFYHPSEQKLIADFYATENAVHESPHSIRKAIAHGDENFILVDLRSPQEYEKEHVIGAINISAYKDPNTSAYEEVDRIVQAFSALDSGKKIIVYCYSMPCMTGRKIGKMLAEHGIYVKHLGIGWNEWRYYWNLWNHDGEDPSKPEDFLASGKEPGVYKGPKNVKACPIDGSLGC